MNDRDFLIWLYERLVNVHREHELYDCMHRLRDIIANTPAGQKAPAVATHSMADLKEIMIEKEKAVV